MLSGVPSSAISSKSSVRISLSARRRSAERQRLEVQAVQQLAVDVRLQLEILRRAAARRGRRRRAAAVTARRRAAVSADGSGVLMIDPRGRLRSDRETTRLRFGGSRLRARPGCRQICRVKLSNCAAISELLVERQRHAGVERRRHGPVVARERVVNRRSRAPSRSASAESGAARTRGSAAPRCARRRRRAGARGRAAAARCGPTARRGSPRGRSCRRRRAPRRVHALMLVAGVDDDVVVRPARARGTAPRSRRRPGASGPVELLGAGEDLEAGLVLRARARCRNSRRGGAGCRSRRARVNRGRTPRNSATSPRPGFRSTMTVGALGERAPARRAQFTAIVVVPAPPLAPKNTSVTHGGFAPASPPRAAPPSGARRRGTIPRSPGPTARHRRPQVKNSFAPARIACRIRSGSARVRDGEDRGAGSAGAQPLDGGHARRGVRPDVDDDDVRRRAVLRGAALDDAHGDAARSAACARSARLNSSSWLTIAAVSCAMSWSVARSVRRRPDPRSALQRLCRYARARRGPRMPRSGLWLQEGAARRRAAPSRAGRRFRRLAHSFVAAYLLKRTIWFCMAWNAGPTSAPVCAK